MARRAALIVLVVAALGWASSCSGLSPTDLAFVDDVRRANPELSVSDASDEWLVDAGQRMCSGRDPARVAAALTRVGIDPTDFGGITVRRLCPRR